ncbi:cholesterol oxidase [Salinimicrobium catena]|uniref:Cholesterol oxidase n=1 Tax=Salinimicrobium catena TaxID=390640 RepID=A0A1H5NZ25_9FLAO|nr:GMC family oxidoreductase [Salinimicrobium catena]SDL58825.1 cholesterol oxidase [Salinimicrobium catena]SEF05968.1 cholesterol oxidase [Salinimicrobium catena]
MNYDYDYIIIGSGFGGSVSALRLSGKGYKVLVIEKGKWFRAEDFPKTNWNLRKWLWMPALRFYGIMKLSIFRHIAVISGTGVGGGSLVYANTLPVPKKAFYASGSWKDLADWETELKPHYEKALQMLGATPNPHLFDGDLALHQMAKEMGREKHFENPNVAVYFGKEGKTVRDPYFGGKGPDRTGCNFCGGCMTGCRHNAKNTLDKNYLWLAQNYGAEILAENEVFDVRPSEEGYEVFTRSSTAFFPKKKSFRAKNVIFSGGVLGTVKLLLKLKKSSLPHLSDKVGDDIRTNNETLISVSSSRKDKDFSKGVAIGSLLHTDEHSHLEIVRYSEGSGFWKLLHLPMASGSNPISRLLHIFGQLFSSPLSWFNTYFINSWSRSTTVLLFMQSVDSTLKLKRGSFGNLATGVSSGKRPTADIPESKELTARYSRIVNGKATSFTLESLAGIPTTAHILGGAVMGRTAEEGVVNSRNEVFNYKGLYVIDGSMISSNPGVNPSLSITAIAEHAMAGIPSKKEASQQSFLKESS